MSEIPVGKGLKDIASVVIVGGIILLSLFEGEGFGTLGCCMIPLGVILFVSGFIKSQQSGLFGQEGGMVLEQKEDGSWGWSKSINSPTPQLGANQYNNEVNQILGRVIKEVQDGKPLESLESNELSILAKTYGVGTGGTDAQKIAGLQSSNLASKALKLGAVVGGTAAVIGGVGPMKELIEKKKQEAIKAAESKLKEEASEVMENLSDPKLDGFFSIIGKHLKTEENYRMAFKMLDLDGDGVISTDEVGIALPSIGAGLLSKEQISQIISIADENNDGVISYDEFVGALKQQMGQEPEIIDTEHEVNTIEEAVLEPEPENNDEIKSEEEPEIIEDEIIDTEYDEKIDQEFEELILEEPVTEELIELTKGIDTALEELILSLEKSRLNSERKEIIRSQNDYYNVTIKIEKMQRTLLGSPGYRGGQTITGLIDGGPYSGLIMVPISMDEEILNHKKGDIISLSAKLTDYSPSLNRPVLEVIID